MLDKDIDRFSAKFGLTAAERQVLGEVIGGNGLLAAAARLNISEATARTHARHIFDKTGTRRQTELIHRFFESAFFGAPDAA
jgi:DNA-binding CsgD family transcriptional regulator